MIQDRIYQIMTTYGLNAVKLASQLGIQPSGISHILNGRRKPSINFLHKILEVFPEINSQWLIEGTGSMVKHGVANDTPHSNKATNDTPSDLFSFENEEFEQDKMDDNTGNQPIEKTKASTNEPIYNREKTSEIQDKQTYIADKKDDSSKNKLNSRHTKEKNISNNRQIERIIVFYNDNTYDELVLKK